MKNILFLDNKSSQKIARSHFLKLEFKNNVVYCSDPVNAINLLSADNFDLLITDYDMPNLSGDEFIYCLKLIKNPKLPVISFSLDEGLNEGMSIENNVITTFNKDYEKLVEFLNQNYFRFKELVEMKAQSKSTIHTLSHPVMNLNDNTDEIIN